MGSTQAGGRIIISYGMPKSASTFAWMLLKDLMNLGGRQVVSLSSEAKGNQSIEDYVLEADAARLERIRLECGAGNVVVKTHSAETAFSDVALFFEAPIVFVQHRDPREIVLSLIDHGARSRSLGINDFAECRDVNSSLLTIDHAMNALFSWIEKRAAHVVSYNDLCFDTEVAIERIKTVLNVNVSTKDIMSRFSERSSIIQFNKGIRDRWKHELSHDDSQRIVARYKRYYDRFGA